MENDAGGVDAVQFVAGCRFGKGNFVFRDWAKPAYTFLSRRSGRAVRVVGPRRGMTSGLRADRGAYVRWVLTAPVEDVLSCNEVRIESPSQAEAHATGTCA